VRVRVDCGCAFVFRVGARVFAYVGGKVLRGAHGQVAVASVWCVAEH